MAASSSVGDNTVEKKWTASVVSASADTTVVVWDLASRTKKQVLRGHTDR